MIRFRLEVESPELNTRLVASVSSDRDDVYPDFMDDLMNRCVSLTVNALASLEDEEADDAEGGRLPDDG